MKVKIRYVLNDLEKEVSGIFKNNMLIFNDEVKNKIIINDDSLLIIRENDEYIIKLEFCLNKDTIMEYTLKDLNKKIEENIHTNYLSIVDKKIDLIYTTCCEEFNYKLEFEVEE